MKNRTELLNSITPSKDVTRVKLSEAYKEFFSNVKQMGNYGGDEWIVVNPIHAKPIVEYALGARNVIDILIRECIKRKVARYNPETGDFEFLENTSNEK